MQDLQGAYDELYDIEYIESFDEFDESNLVIGDGCHSIELTNHADTYYRGTIFVGSPPQKLSVIYDTGSLNFVVASSLCKYGSCSGMNAVYDPFISKSANKPVIIWNSSNLLNIFYSTAAISA